MTLRPLGTTGLQVSPLCFGGNVLGWTLDGDEAFAVLDRYAQRPGAFIDTADAYSAWVDGHEGGESERLLAQWLALRGGAHGVVLATKVGWRGGLGRENVLRSAHASLDRLGLERVDLLYAHKDDPDTPLDETLAAFDALVREGRVGHVGLSNYSPARLRLALDTCDLHGLTRPTVVQPPYSLVARDEFEGELQEVCAQEGLGVATYAALAAGFLTGKYTRGGPAPETARARSVAQRFGGDDAWAALDALLEVARERDAEPAAVAVAWVMAQPSVTSAIASATSVAQLDTLHAALDLDLTDAELARLGQTHR